MNTQTAFIVVAVAVALVALVFVLARRSRTADLKARLSPGYERVLAEHRRNAESVPFERQKRASRVSVDRPGPIRNHRPARELALKSELDEEWTEDLRQPFGNRHYADDGIPPRVSWRSRRSLR